jgi:co-chaperonin GroES (HSP10)
MELRLMKAAYSAHRISKLQALNDSVLVEDMTFDERISNGGIVLLNDTGKSSGIRPRWGRVYATGPEQTDVRVGEWVCVAHGRWTRGLDIEDGDVKRTIRKIDPKDILISADERPNDLTFSDAIHVERKER